MGVRGVLPVHNTRHADNQPAAFVSPLITLAGTLLRGAIVNRTYGIPGT